MSDKPNLYWIELGAPPAEAGPARLFDAHCTLLAGGMDELRVALADSAIEAPDAICFECDYPDLTALDQIAKTKQRYSSILMLMVTLQSSAQLAVWALRARLFDYLIKPIDEGEVARCMERLNSILQLKRHQSVRQALPTAQSPREARYKGKHDASTAIGRAAPYIAKHYARPLSAAELARVCGLSPSSFSRQFRARFGVGFQQYLNERRLDEACRLLENQSMAITDVGAAVGFDDPSYFTRIFRRQTGTTPSGYRALLASQRQRRA